MKYTLHIAPSMERQYPRLSFDVPENAERIDVTAAYPRFETDREGEATLEKNQCTIDLALETPDGTLMGSAGSDRTHVWVSPLGSCAGFGQEELPSGRWRVIAGAYHIPPDGVTVEYEIEIAVKSRRLFKGDTHAHTVASDGSATLQELTGLARQLKLHFLFITDHNNVSSPASPPDITLLPGTEWTHYNGHAGFLGSSKPLPGRYDTCSEAETVGLMDAARRQGAMVVLNHPFCPLVPWLWGFQVPYDGVEVWNGVMSQRNEQAIAWWHGQLCLGARIPVTGGSDYHRPGLLGSLAMPCTCLYALSRSPEDLMKALRKGDGFITYLPDGPTVDVACQGPDPVSFGGVAPKGAALQWSWKGLAGGDEIRLITDAETEVINCPQGTRELNATRAYGQAKFVRAELIRTYAPGLPPMKALLSNPVYFEE